MAAAKVDVASLAENLIKDARAGVFKPVYLLMGDEPYYPELVCSAILENCVGEFGKDFNETVCYGADVTPEQVISAARRFPMLSDRQLVLVREAQAMKGLEELSVYAAAPMDTTVLVILMHKSSADKRKSLYKTVQKTGVVLDSPAVRDYEVAEWIQKYYRSRGLNIEPQAAALLGESAGTDLLRIVAETDKLLKNLSEGSTAVSVGDVERNVGISREFSIFELTKELSYRNSAKALKIASRIGTAAKFQMPAAVSAIFNHFYRILKYGTLLLGGGSPSPEDKAWALPGVNPYFYKEYDAAVRNYPVPSAMAIIGILCEYDYLGKGGDGGAAPPDALLMELVSKILNT